MTITREQAAGIANIIAQFRPEWNLRYTTDEIVKLDGTLSTVAEHALKVASDWGNKAPIRISQIPMHAKHSDKPGDKSACYWCHRTEYACRQAQRNTGLDPHAYRATDTATVADHGAPQPIPGV